MDILQLTSRIPYPLTDGGAIGIYNLTKYLHIAGHRITLLSLNTNKHFQNPDVMRDICQDIQTSTINTDITIFNALKNLLVTTFPYNAERFFSNEFARLLQSTLQQKKFDIIHVDSAFMLWYIDTIRESFSSPQDCPPIILRAHNVEYLISERLARNPENPFKRWYLKVLAKRMKNFEKTYFQKCDGILAITREDEQLIRSLGYTKPVGIMPAGVDTQFFSPNDIIQPKQNTIFFFGSLDWMPNIEAVHWFMDAVWQKIHEKLPELEFHIGGKNPPPEIQRYADNQKVFLHPNVASAPDFMQQFNIMVVPLLSGGGMRLKIVEAMVMAKPIISTTIGAEGISGQPQPHLIRADSPDEIVDAIVQLFHDPSFRTTLSQNARAAAVNHYSWDHVILSGINFYESLIQLRR